MVTAKEHERLINLLMLTTSNNDHEALLACRKANELLARHCLSWRQFIDSLSRPPRQRREEPKKPDGTIDWASEIDRLLRTVKNQDSRDFLTSVKQFYMTRGFITEKQQEAVRKYM